MELLQPGAICHDDGHRAVPYYLPQLDVNERGEAVQVRFRDLLQKDRWHLVHGAAPSASRRAAAAIANAGAHHQAVLELHGKNLRNIALIK